MSSYSVYCLDPNGLPVFTPDGKPDLAKGELFVSVSTILAMENPGEFLQRWLLSTFGGEPDPFMAYQNFMEKVSSLGTRLHRFFELDLKNLRKEADKVVTDELLPGVESYLRWKKKHDIELIDSERIVFCKKLRIGGTVDVMLKIDGQNYICDFKTGSVQEKAFTQLCIYKHLATSMGISTAKDAKLLVLGGKDTKSKVVDGGDMQMHTMESMFGKHLTEADLFSAFMCLRHLWMIKNIKSKKFSPVIKHLQEALDPMIERFKNQFLQT